MSYSEAVSGQPPEKKPMSTGKKTQNTNTDVESQRNGLA